MSLRTESVVFDVLTSDPTSPVEGQVWFNSTDKLLKMYHDGAIRPVTTLWPSRFSPAATVRVHPTDPSADFQTIQAAIDATGPQPVVISVAPGTYAETLTITGPRQVKIIGERASVRGGGPIGNQVSISLGSTSLTDLALVTLVAPTSFVPRVEFENISFSIQNTAPSAAQIHVFRLVDNTVAGSLTCALTLKNCNIGISENGNSSSQVACIKSVQSTRVAFYAYLSDVNVLIQGTATNCTVWELNSTASREDRLHLYGSNQFSISSSASTKSVFVCSGFGEPAILNWGVNVFSHGNSSVPYITIGGVGRIFNYGVFSRLDSLQQNPLYDVADNPTALARAPALTESFYRTSGSIRMYKAALRPIAGSPGADLADGDIWYDSTLGKFRARENGVTVDVRGGGSGTPGGSNGQVQYNNAGNFGGAGKLAIDAGGYPILGEASTSTPASPSAGSTLFSRLRAGRRMAGQVGPSGVDYAFQPFLAANKVSLWTANGNGTTVSLVGFNNTVTGTATARNVATTDFASSLRRVAFVSATTAGSSAGTRHNALQFWRGNAAGRGGFLYVARFVVDTVVTDMRWFVGLSGSAAVIGNVNPSTLTNILGFGIDSGQTTVRFFNNDGTGAATATDLGASFPATTANVVYEARLFCAPNGAEVFYSLERLDSAALVEGSVTTDIPANTTLLSPQIWVNNGTTAAAVALAVVSQYIETDY